MGDDAIADSSVRLAFRMITHAQAHEKITGLVTSIANI